MVALCDLTGELGLAQSVHESESILCSSEEEKTLFLRDKIQTMTRIKTMTKLKIIMISTVVVNHY